MQQRFRYIFLFCLIIAVYAGERQEVREEGTEADESDVANGWNNDIDWVHYEDSLDIAEKEKKPIFLLFHKSWCGACKALKALFVKAKEIKRLSTAFVMVNIKDDDGPEGESFSPDGDYIPRLIFMSPEGDVLKDVYNEKNKEQHKYYYPDPGTIIKSMKKVMNKFGSKPKDEL